MGDDDKDSSETPVGFKEMLPPHPIETRTKLYNFIGLITTQHIYI